MFNHTLFYKVLILVTLGILNINIAKAGLPKAPVKVTARDRAITTKIKALYAKSPVVKTALIEVATINRTVFLKGKLNNNNQYQCAITLAGMVDGVKIIQPAKLHVIPQKETLTKKVDTVL